MSFSADKQTLDDLNLLGKYKSGSIFSLFNKVISSGGEKLLEHYFFHPLDDPDKINERSRLFRYFQDKSFEFPFKKAELEQVQKYLSEPGGNFLSCALLVASRKITSLTIHDDAYAQLELGINAALSLLIKFQSFLDEVSIHTDLPELMDKGQLDFLGKSWFQPVDELSIFSLLKYDHLLRSRHHAAMSGVLDNIYRIDVLITIGRIAAEKGFGYATALNTGGNIFRASGLRHPGLDEGVSNPVYLHQESNVLFLTGANMAGKSTLMKTLGISLYLAHIGFPLAADSLEFTLKQGMYTSINVPDNLSMGYSHFYAEVLRVKHVAEEVASGKNLLVIFDELFKGTNVKDAYDATLAVSEGFAEYENCLFVISTHIIEVGEVLREQSKNVQFSYLPTIMEGTVPKYTYRLENGITTDKHGMIIIENEQILEIIAGDKS